MDVQAAKMIGAGLAMIGAIGAGIGVGNIWAALITAVARNPSVQGQVTGPAFIGFAVTEAIALFALTVSLLILFVF
jgi:F-type H+-transporting ATPase subunit c